MSIYKTYHLPKTIQDALQALDAPKATARLIAGGTDLLLDLQQGRHPPVDHLVDVTGIPELTCLEIRQGELFVGAAVPLFKITLSPLVQRHAQALVEACALVGGPQVRNSATLGGNVAHALPAADGTVALVALGAQAEIAGPQGLRRGPILELFRGPGVSTLDPRKEILVGFYLPLMQAGQASAFARIMRPQGVALPIINMAAWVHRVEDQIVDIRLSVGPAGPTPRRILEAEQVLQGRVYDRSLNHLAYDALLESARFRTSPQRATADYRRHLSGVLLDEVLEKVWHRAAPDLPVEKHLEAR